MSHTKLSVSLPEGLVGQMDAARGDVPRSVWIRRAVERALDAEPPTYAGMPIVVDPRMKPGQARVVSRAHSPTCKCAICSPPKR